MWFYLSTITINIKVCVLWPVGTVKWGQEAFFCMYARPSSLGKHKGIIQSFPLMHAAGKGSCSVFSHLVRDTNLIKGCWLSSISTWPSAHWLFSRHLPVLFIHYIHTLHRCCIREQAAKSQFIVQFIRLEHLCSHTLLHRGCAEKLVGLQFIGNILEANRDGKQY